LSLESNSSLDASGSGARPVSRTENDWLGRGPVKEIAWTGINGTGVQRVTTSHYRHDGKLVRKDLPTKASFLYGYDNRVLVGLAFSGVNRSHHPVGSIPSRLRCGRPRLRRGTARSTRSGSFWKWVACEENRGASGVPCRLPLTLNLRVSLRVRPHGTARFRVGS
jgi:hypothetical protein